ncbi:MAG: hypothetical protein A4E28_00735 [Methanocella sp. PtaU1.Bin125]|nr:MAG: hypothetical protein A4E28_00735 [Methanocella sp. PtaU1.Bin125]
MLAEAGRLKLRPLCVYGSDTLPEGAVPSHVVDRCIARAIYASALHGQTPPLYVEEAHEACCSGGRMWMGFAEPHPKLKYFVTVGASDFRGGAAERLKAAPELFDESKRRAGKITPPGRYVIIGPCSDDVPAESVRSLILFGGCEQIRNLCALAQYNSSDPFFRTLIPWGASCSTMITYPAGLAANATDSAAYVGPTDPTGNQWFPPDLMVMGIPIRLARQMAADIGGSFIAKRDRIAFPEHRLPVKLPSIGTQE